ncbi:cobalt ECF transporter T component CbiQ [Ruthenibacterium lactatiformans]|jgi:cobalt ABC transporter, permease protein cbiQ|uniref:cobalt ECF transporter T component CbiQ n=1 Tax=Ruthenibacterium lactatiformans TaxID=1550024 RepID=UPI00155A247D|nr:cobalt ECF transporter T component CbiQ [Ruthenibacterium lactatiformans]
MFNALLGSFVAWSLTAGALPGPWPAAASLALGGALLLLLLLHGHTHGAALTVDVLARRSRFLTVNPGLKLWCCAALLALCLLARTPWPPLALFFAASALTAAGGVRPRAYLSLLGAPAAFLLLSGIALLWEYASAPGGVANVPFLGGYFVLRAPAQTAARLVMARALGAVGCLYFLSLSTPVPELLDALRRARVPEVVGDLAVLIYRYIFILFATFRSMRDAAASRLGYAGPVRSLRTTGRVYGGLLAHSFRRAQACFDAMESRCYDGGIRFLTREKPVRAPHALVCGALTAGMVLALVCGA